MNGRKMRRMWQQPGVFLHISIQCIDAMEEWVGPSQGEVHHSEYFCTACDLRNARWRYRATGQKASANACSCGHLLQRRFQDRSLFICFSSSHRLLFSSYTPEALTDLRGAGGRQCQWRAVEPVSLATALPVGWNHPWDRQMAMGCILLSWQVTWTGCISFEGEASSFNYNKLSLSTIPDLVHWMLYPRLFSVVLSAILQTLSAASFSECLITGS